MDGACLFCDCKKSIFLDAGFTLAWSCVKIVMVIFHARNTDDAPGIQS